MVFLGDSSVSWYQLFLCWPNILLAITFNKSHLHLFLDLNSAGGERRPGLVCDALSFILLIPFSTHLFQIS